MRALLILCLLLGCYQQLTAQEPAPDNDAFELPDLTGDWLTGQVRISVEQVGEEITATYREIGKNPYGIKAGDPAFSGTFEEREFDGTIVLFVKKKKEIVQRNAELTLTLSEDGQTLTGEHELEKYDGKKDEWITLKRKQKVVLKKDGGGKVFMRFVKNTKGDLKPDRVEGEFVTIDEVVYGAPVYVEAEYEVAPKKDFVLAELTLAGKTREVSLYPIDGNDTIYRSRPIYPLAKVRTGAKKEEKAEAKKPAETPPDKPAAPAGGAQ